MTTTRMSDQSGGWICDIGTVKRLKIIGYLTIENALPNCEYESRYSTHRFSRCAREIKHGKEAGFIRLRINGCGDIIFALLTEK